MGSEMEAYNNRKGGVYLLAFLAVLILRAYCCSSAVLVDSNSTPPGNGGLGECLLLEDDMEFPMNPYIRRRLFEPVYTPNTLESEKVALPPCGPTDHTPYCTQKLNPCNRGDYYRPKCK